jgi:hypothetical protein
LNFSPVKKKGLDVYESVSVFGSPDFGREQVSISLEGGVNTPLLAAVGVPIPYKKV